MNYPEFSLFVYYFIIGSYEGFILAITFIILFFKLNGESPYYRPLSIITFCGYTIASLLQIWILPYIKVCVTHAFGPMSDWIHGANDAQVIFTGTISTALITVLLGLKKIKYI